MTTLLEIYESYMNGQRKQFAGQVNTYGADHFARDIETDSDVNGLPVLTDYERFSMLKTYIIINQGN